MKHKVAQKTTRRIVTIQLTFSQSSILIFSHIALQLSVLCPSRSGHVLDTTDLFAASEIQISPAQ